ncbi:polysaccharide biosynthesis protein [Parasphingorhabdus sp.]|jgi:nucleoside-diphosphate-sugar epimerase|uniref:polysaccharide biosynthesis protein n=1 Tax=Parasphingorhabdus sp. TaxID=2709688 RepID=UPI0032F03D4F
MLSKTDILSIIGRKKQLFTQELNSHREVISNSISGARVLIIGAAGSIGSATTIQLADFGPKQLHLLDINENEMADLVRRLRVGEHLQQYTELRSFIIDVNDPMFEVFCRDGRGYDFVFNLSAMKHVRSESNLYSLARLIETNIISTIRIIKYLSSSGPFKYFCVSTDKAANPVNLMGMSKLVMENYAFSNEFGIPVSSARFANVAFSSGSLLESFDRRIRERRPLVIPQGIKRYFISEEEAGSICLLSCIIAPHRGILVPSENSGLQLIAFEHIVEAYLDVLGFSPEIFEAGSNSIPVPDPDGATWPVVLSAVDTTGEKPFEEFMGAGDALVESSFRELSIILKDGCPPLMALGEFERRFFALRASAHAAKSDYVSLLTKTGATIDYADVGKYLDDKM